MKNMSYLQQFTSLSMITQSLHILEYMNYGLGDPSPYDLYMNYKQKCVTSKHKSPSFIYQNKAFKNQSE